MSATIDRVRELLGQTPEYDVSFAEGATEVRVIDPTTGGEKGSKIERFDLIPVGPLRKLARHFGLGSQKYADRNWERGYAWSLSFAAMQRHAWAFWQGEDTDPETGDEHLAAVAWHAMALLEWAETHPELDDRPRRNGPTGPKGPTEPAPAATIPRASIWPSQSFDTNEPEGMAAAQAFIASLAPGVRGAA